MTDKRCSISYFIWKGAIFKVPLSTLQKPKENDCRALINVTAKCMTLFIQRLEKQSQRTGTLMAEWIEKWNLHARSSNPPDITRVQRKLEYLHRYNIEAAYIPTRGTPESNKSYRRRLYECLLTSINAAVGQP